MQGFSHIVPCRSKLLLFGNAAASLSHCHDNKMHLAEISGNVDLHIYKMPEQKVS